jgi:hypothetical protein
LGCATNPDVASSRHHNASVNPSPATDGVVCSTDQTNTVCFSCSPKYSRTIQKPASSTWQKNTDPAPIASAISELWVADNPETTGALTLRA